MSSSPRSNAVASPFVVPEIASSEIRAARRFLVLGPQAKQDRSVRTAEGNERLRLGIARARTRAQNRCAE